MALKPIPTKVYKEDKSNQEAMNPLPFSRSYYGEAWATTIEPRGNHRLHQILLEAILQTQPHPLTHQLWHK